MYENDTKVLLVDIKNQLVEWVVPNLTNPELYMQAGISFLLLFSCWFLAKKVKKHFIENFTFQARRIFYPILFLIRNLTFPILAYIVFSIYNIAAGITFWPSSLTVFIAKILLAWTVISIAFSIIGKGQLVSWVKYIILIAVGLSLVDLLNPVIEFFNSLAIEIGDTHLSVYTILKGVTVLVVLLGIVGSISRTFDRYIEVTTELSPSLKVLTTKVVKITLYTVTILIGLNAIGLDLTAFTIFSGAVGVGLGFGLQKVVSNFISGIILLSDRSIKPGDVIAIGDTYGWVNSLGARYVSVITRDGKEHLIPNELLITEKVENWSFTNNEVRLRIPVGVSYKTNLEKAIELVLEAAADTKRILEKPSPRCLIREFADSSVNLELRAWVDDPINGMGNIQSDILLNVWKKFQKHNIEIPFPQRDVHLFTEEKPAPRKNGNGNGRSNNKTKTNNKKKT